MKKRSLIILVLLILLIGVGSFGYYKYRDGLQAIFTNKPLDFNRAKDPLLNYIPESFDGAWRTEDMKALLTAFYPSPLGQLVRDTDYSIQIMEKIDPSDPTGAKKMCISFAEGIVQACLATKEADVLLMLELKEGAEDTFRNILAKIAKTNSLFLDAENNIESISGGNSPALFFRFKEKHLLISTSSLIVEMIDEPLENHYTDAYCTRPYDGTKHILGSCKFAESQLLFENTIGNWGSKWKLTQPKADFFSNKDVKITPISNAPSYEHAIASAVASVDLLKAFSANDGDAQFDIVARISKELPEFCDFSADLDYSGAFHYVWAEKSLFNHPFLGFPVKEGKNIAEQLTKAARENEIEVVTSNKYPDVYYLKQSSEKSLPFRFWLQRENLFMASQSQFAITKTLEYQQGKKAILPENTIAHIRVDFKKVMESFGIMASLLLKDLGSDTAKLKQIIGNAEIIAQIEGDEVIINGTSDLPLGFVLHVVAASYNK